MELAQLAAYAEKKYGMHEQHKWAEFPGFSVLAEPSTGKWVALLMRQWDFDLGIEIQKCDIKCGMQAVALFREPYVSGPFRMKGEKWVGISFGQETREEVVCHLLDLAVAAEQSRGYAIVLEETPSADEGVYHDTPLALRAEGRRPEQEPRRKQHPLHRQEAQRILRNVPERQPIPGNAPERQPIFRDVPDRILEMMHLYEYGSNSYENKSRNFYRQGKFMEDYEDDAPWDGSFHQYFPTYHDLNIRLLRGYFSWRTQVRKGHYHPIAVSLSYLYVYELLCGIGTAGPSDTLTKLQKFETGFLDAGYGDEGMRRNLRRWMLEYAVLHDVPPETTIQYADPAAAEQDTALAILKAPGGCTDEALFEAICRFAGKKLAASPVIARDEARGKQMFAALWRSQAGQLFEACFGKPVSFPWHPLANAVYWEEETQRDREYCLNASRSYCRFQGSWTEKRYNSLFFNLDRFRALWHATDVFLRRYYKTSHYLKEKPEEAWARPLIEAVVAAQEKEAALAARPKIEIDLSGLDRIRRDALATQSSLLTPEEMKQGAPDRTITSAGIRSEAQQPGDAFVDNGTQPPPAAVEKDMQKPPAAVGKDMQKPPAAVGKDMQKPTVTEDNDIQQEPAGSPDKAGVFPGLDEVHHRILYLLLDGEPVSGLIREKHLLPSIVADTINEALSDEIGDIVVECNDGALALIEDYREDILKILKKD